MGCNANLDVEGTASDTHQKEAELTKDPFLIRDNLYRDKKGELYFRVVDWTDEPIFLEVFGISDRVNSHIPARLRTHIDPKSWRHVFDSLYADTDTLYCHHALSGGGWIGAIDGFNPNALKVILTQENGKWRTIDIDDFDLSKKKDVERAWHFTDGHNVLGYRCDVQGPLDSWTPN